MVLTAPFYDAYNSRYRKIEMMIWKYVFGEYLKNKKRYDRGLFGKNVHHNNGTPRTTEKWSYRNTLRCL